MNSIFYSNLGFTGFSIISRLRKMRPKKSIMRQWNMFWYLVTLPIPFIIVTLKKNAFFLSILLNKLNLFRLHSLTSFFISLANIICINHDMAINKWINTLVSYFFILLCFSWQRLNVNSWVNFKKIYSDLLTSNILIMVMTKLWLFTSTL